MGWKDSGDSVVYPDGSLVKGPVALCELQGYVYDAWVRMAEVFDALGKSDRAQELRAKAAALFAISTKPSGTKSWLLRLRARWREEKVLTVASNAGHCLWPASYPRARQKSGAAPDGAGHVDWMGIRTLSANHPAFNPYNYQTGSVWPHDNAIIALASILWLRCRSARIAHDISVAASHFQLNQLPELYTAFEREETAFRCST